MELKNRVAIVTGAARGIGRATAVALADAGARAVVLADVKEAELGEAAERVEAAGCEALPVVANVGDLASLRALFARAEDAFGRIDILHNNAGIGEGPGDWPALAPERSRDIVDVNLRGVVLGTQLALPLMKRGGGGAIVNTASGAAFVPLPPQAVYAATKAAVVHFTRSCAPLRESHGVRVNCVCPGLVETPMIHETGVDGMAEWLKPIYEAAPPIRPEEVAAAVLDLVRDDRLAGEVVKVGNA